MASNRSRAALYEFLDYVSQKGLIPTNTALARRASVGKVFAVLDEDESQDVTAVDLDALMARFQNLHGKGYTPDSLSTYKSRVKAAVEDFASYVQNPLTWRPRKSAASATPRPGKPSDNGKAKPAPKPPVAASAQPAGPMSTSILPIPIRADLTVLIQGLPYDLTAAEAKKIAGVIQALAGDT